MNLLAVFIAFVLGVFVGIVIGGLAARLDAAKQDARLREAHTFQSEVEKTVSKTLGKKGGRVQ